MSKMNQIAFLVSILILGSYSFAAENPELRSNYEIYAQVLSESTSNEIQFEIGLIMEEGDWSYANIKSISKSSDTLQDNAPQLALGKYDGSTWNFAFPNDSQYKQWMNDVPETLLTPDEKAYLGYSSDIPLINVVNAQNVADYLLPWAYNTYWAVTNINGSSHTGTYAIDFDTISIDDSILATKPGIVVFRKDVSNFTCEDISCYKKANLVVIKHSDNEYSWYMHLKQNSIPDEIQEGTTVCRGQKIGEIGKTGYSFGEHLHFQAVNTFSCCSGTGDDRFPSWVSGIDHYYKVDFDEVSYDNLVKQNYKSQNTLFCETTPAPPREAHWESQTCWDLSHNTACSYSGNYINAEEGQQFRLSFTFSNYTDIPFTDPDNRVVFAHAAEGDIASKCTVPVWDDVPGLDFQRKSLSGNEAGYGQRVTYYPDIHNNWPQYCLLGTSCSFTNGDDDDWVTNNGTFGYAEGPFGQNEDGRSIYRFTMNAEPTFRLGGLGQKRINFALARNGNWLSIGEKGGNGCDWFARSWFGFNVVDGSGEPPTESPTPPPSPDQLIQEEPITDLAGSAVIYPTTYIFFEWDYPPATTNTIFTLELQKDNKYDPDQRNYQAFGTYTQQESYMLGIYDFANDDTWYRWRIKATTPNADWTGWKEFFNGDEIPGFSTFTPTNTKTPSFTRTPTSTPSSISTFTPSQTWTASATPSITLTLTSTRTKVPTITQTFTKSPTYTFTSSNTANVTLTATPSLTSTQTATATSSRTKIPTSTPIGQKSPTSTSITSNTATSTITSTSSFTTTPTSTNTNTPSTTSTPANTATLTITPILSPTNTSTSTQSPTNSITPSNATLTFTPTPSFSNTETITVTATRTKIPTFTPIPPTYTFTPSNTATVTLTATPSLTRTQTATATSSRTKVPTITKTMTRTKTPSKTVTPSITPLITATYTPSLTETSTETPIPTGGGSPQNFFVGASAKALL